MDCEYTAFCLDQACDFILDKLEEIDDKGKQVNKPRWIEDEEKTESTNSNNELISMLRGL